MRRLHCSSPQELRDQDALNIDFSHCDDDGASAQTEQHQQLVFLLTLVFVGLVLVAVVILALVMVIRRFSLNRLSPSPSPAGAGTKEPIYKSLPYPGDVRRRAEEEEGCNSSSASYPSSKPLLAEIS